ncbi:MAG: SIMPL domain-containing protein [Propionibacteriaceae bacterium]|jgi:uncharacterized protein YggE|nr:SIMPL domain-containing protein [Propionibacteriaceae bacterium]
MPTSIIHVHGSARDTRSPDSATIRVEVSKWGRDWNLTHQAVRSTVEGLMDDLQQLAADNPKALENPVVVQVSKRSWTDGIGVAYSETVDVAATFSDFQVMSQWVFTHSTETISVYRIDWSLTAATKKEATIALSVAAMREARRKAEAIAAAAGLVIVGIESLTEPPEAGDTSETLATLPGESPSATIEITPTPVDLVVRVEAQFRAELDPDSDTTTRRAPSLFFA